MTELIADWSNAGLAVGRWLLHMNGWTAVLLATALLADQLLARRVAARWRLWLYAPVLLRLALPLDWTTPVGMLERAAAPVPVVVEARPPSAPRPIAASGASPAPARTTSTHSALGMLIPLVWGGGAVGLLLIAGRRRLRLRRAVLGADEIRTPPLGARAFEHASLGPGLFGLRHPRIVLPTPLLRSMTVSQLRWIVEHEEVHRRRGDHVLAAGIQVIVAAAWPVLPLWFGAARVRALMEQACDEAVVHGRSAAARGAYARTLVDVLDQRAVGRLHLARAAELTFGAGAAARLRALRHTRRWSGVVQVVLVAAVAAGITACASRQPTAAPAQTATAAPTPEQIMITVRLLDGWPSIPALDFRLQQRGTAESDAPRPMFQARGLPPGTYLLDRAGVQRFDQSAADDPNVTLVSAPRLLVLAGEPAQIRIEEDGRPVVQLDVTAWPTAEGTRLEYRFEGVDEDGVAHVVDATPYVIPAGTASATMLASRVGGGWRMLVLEASPVETVEPGEPTESASARPRPLPAGAPQGAAVQSATPSWTRTMSWPQVMVMMSLHEVDATASVGRSLPRDARVVPVAYGEAWVLDDADTDRLFDLIRDVDGSRWISSPAVITASGESASLESGSSDKGGALVDGNAVDVIPTADGDATRLDLAWRNVSADDRGELAIRAARLDAGESLVAVLPSVNGRRLLLTARPTVLHGPEDYPFQRSAAAPVAE